MISTHTVFIFWNCNIWHSTYITESWSVLHNPLSLIPQLEIVYSTRVWHEECDGTRSIGGPAVPLVVRHGLASWVQAPTASSSTGVGLTIRVVLEVRVCAVGGTGGHVIGIPCINDNIRLCSGSSGPCIRWDTWPCYWYSLY